MIYDKNETLTVIGLGYIGLPTAIILAENSDVIYGYDSNKNLINNLNNNSFDSTEPNLLNKLNKVFQARKLIVENQLIESNTYIICVPTPILEDKSIDTNHIQSVVIEISRLLKKDDLIILESTVSPGTTRNVIGESIRTLTGLVPGTDFKLAYSAERVIPGNIFYELENNTRIIGGIDSDSALLASGVYRRFCKGEIELSTLETAEITKLFENTYRDVNISLANTFLNISAKYNIDAWEAIRLANFHPRVNILTPGIGVGGHCIAVDPWFLYENDDTTEIIGKARFINDSMPGVFFEFINKVVQLKGLPKKASILGLSYKADIEDTRESPSLDLVNIMNMNDWELFLTDPYIKDNKLVNLTSLENALLKSKLIVITVGHSYYLSELFLTQLKNSHKRLTVIQSGPFIKSQENLEVFTFGEV